jgi:hypothetical protein
MTDDDPIPLSELYDAINHVRRLCLADPHRHAQWFADYLRAYLADEALDPAEYLTALDNEQGREVRRLARWDKRDRLLREEAEALFPGLDYEEQARLLAEAMQKQPQSARLREVVELSRRPIKKKAVRNILRPPGSGP